MPGAKKYIFSDEIDSVYESGESSAIIAYSEEGISTELRPLKLMQPVKISTVHLVVVFGG